MSMRKRNRYKKCDEETGKEGNQDDAYLLQASTWLYLEYPKRALEQICEKFE